MGSNWSNGNGLRWSLIVDYCFVDAICSGWVCVVNSGSRLRLWVYGVLFFDFLVWSVAFFSKNTCQTGVYSGVGNHEWKRLYD